MAVDGSKIICKIQNKKSMENKNIAPPFETKDLEKQRMILVNVYSDNHVSKFMQVEVAEDIYKILQQKVIKSLTNNVELQTFLQDAKITLDRFMESSITEKMLTEAVNEWSI